MKTLVAIPFLIGMGYLTPKTAVSQTTYVDNGTSTTYTLQTGDSLYIKQGTFTGQLNDWNQGGKVTIASGATFKPSGVNGFRSKYVVNGTMIVSSLPTEGGFGLKNYGTVTVNGNTQMNGTAQVWTNYAGAVLNLKGSVAFNADGSTITNYADMTLTGDFTMYGNVSIINKKNLSFTGNFNSSKGQISNEGKFYSQKKITLGGTTMYTNTCRTIAENGIIIDNASAAIYNSGILWASNAANTSSFTNSGTITSSGNGVIKTVTFINYGNIKGNGFMYITGKSTLGSSASVGVSASTADTLKIYTVNRTKTTQIFDDQWGTVYANAKYAVVAAPDTVGYTSYACSSEYTSTLLPVSWNDFSVQLIKNIPVINWSATFDDGTIFIVQESYNGVDFSAVYNVKGKYAMHDYSFTDNTLPSAHPSIVYYRVCAVEPSGVQKFTAIKALKFEKETTASPSLTGKPNPFTGQFSIDYTASQKQAVTIKVFNFNGQVQFTKQMSAVAGKNSFSITDTGKWISGIYIVQLLPENGTSMSVKMIKQ